jgi:hypothetical protein
MITALLAAAPSIYKLFTSDDKDEAVKDLTGQVIKSAAGALGSKATTKDEIMTHISSNPEDVYKLKKLEQDFELKIKELNLKEMEIQEQNITDRWKSDNKSDSRFAKLLRPGITAFLELVITILALLDGNAGEFTIKEHWVTLFTSLTLTAVGGYFTLRTFEKKSGTSNWKK